MARTYKTLLQGIALSETLNLLTVDRLKELIDLLPGATRPTRKAEIIAVLRRRLTGKSLPKLWHELDEIQRLAVSETLYGPDGAFAETRFRAKYGVMPAFDTPVSRTGYRATRPTLLRLFLYPADRYDSEATVICTRSKRRAAGRRSSAVMARLTADWVVPSSLAAALKLPSRAARSKVRRRCIDGIGSNGGGVDMAHRLWKGN